MKATMNRILLFNCSNDMALAADGVTYRPPKNILRMEEQLSMLPLWWAEDGDAVMVSDVDEANNFLASLHKQFKLPEIVTVDERYGYERLCKDTGRMFVPCPWGWSRAVAKKFRHFGVPEELIPTEKQLAEWRRLSSRKFAVEYMEELLPELDACGVGDAVVGREMKYWESVENCMLDFSVGDKKIFKSPWSSSGRGVFVVSDGLDSTAESRLRGYVRAQGGFVSDKYYDKSLDFAVEYEVKKDGSVDFLGYSVFSAAENGKYGYNMVGEQTQLRELIDRTLADVKVGADLIDRIRQCHSTQLAHCLGGIYTGCVGIDMLVAKEKGRTVVHPCIEINLRMNMGILALHLSRLPERLLPLDGLARGADLCSVNLNSPISTPLTPIRINGFNARLDAGRFILSFS